MTTRNRAPTAGLEARVTWPCHGVARLASGDRSRLRAEASARLTAAPCGHRRRAPPAASAGWQTPMSGTGLESRRLVQVVPPLPARPHAMLLVRHARPTERFLVMGCSSCSERLRLPGEGGGLLLAYFGYFDLEI